MGRLLAALIMTAIAACGGGAGTAPMNAPPPPGPMPTAVSELQGSGASSPIVGQTVTIEAIVTGDFQDNDADGASNLGGFFVQSISADADPNTSEGVFVFDGSTPSTDVNIGDRVTVSGEIQEFFGETQLAATSVSVSASGMVQPTEINLPFASVSSNSDGDAIAELERYEGMLVRFPQALTVTELFNLERYGEVRLSEGGRLYQFTNRNSPDPVGYANHRNTIATRTIVLDDGQRASNAAPIRFLNAGTSPNVALRVGDSVTGLTGNLRYSRGSGNSGKETWRLMPTTAPVFDSMNPRPGAPVTGGDLRVASFNVLNYFSNIDSGQSSCGPSGNSGCRGADSVEELNRQLAKITNALLMIDADIVGLVELENNASDSLADIVGALNAVAGAGTYAFVDTGTIGDDAIKTGFLFKPASIGLQGPIAILDGSVDPRFDDNRNRPALAQSFSATGSGAIVTIVVNHLKSKGSDCDAAGDPNTGDGQGNCNQTRTNAAAAIADWLALDPTASGDNDFLIIGDLNAHILEDPLSALKNAGYINLVEAASGGDAYSFVFDGQAGALDHALASASLAPQVVETIEWHINADEATVRDYNLENSRDPGIFDGTTPYRASDHDPVIIGLDLAN